MEIPRKPRYDYCFKRAYDLLEEYNVDQFPLDPKFLIEDNYFKVISYAELARLKKTTIFDVCFRLHTSVAITFYDNHNYYVFYNNTLNKNYMRFSLMHELGHIYLGHLRDFEKTQSIPTSQALTKLSKREYRILEKEADSFAGNTLIPLWTLNHFDTLNSDVLSRFFGVTPSCGSTRISVMKDDIQSAKDCGLFDKVNQLSANPIYGQGCIHCENITLAYEKYCPICGNPLEKGVVNGMKYPMLNTYENGKLKYCPICQNEEVMHDGDYCQICGCLLKNKCNNCSSILPSNARFCPFCGDTSMFFNSNFILDWQSEKAAQEGNSGGFMDIPEGIEEELPNFDDFPFG